jgi:hypothetical protein
MNQDLASDRSRTTAGTLPESPVRSPRYSLSIRSIVFDLSLLTVFWLLFFWSIIVARDHLIPYDLIDQHYMFQAFLHRAIVDGEAPWWTPNILGGYPIVADPITALFYPPNLLMHAFTPDAFLPYIRLEFQLALHFHWAAVGTYFLARSLTGSRAGALLAALVFAYGAFFAWHTPHLSPISSLSWLPWIMLSFLNALRHRSALWTGAGAGAFGAMVLAGHALTIVQISYLLAGLTIGLAFHGWRQPNNDRQHVVSTFLIGGAIIVLGTGLAAIQLLPSLELSSQTNRANFTWADASGSSYMPHWLVTAVVPNFFAHDGPAPYWASGDPAETNSYVGLLPLFLAVLAVTRAKPSDRGITTLLTVATVIALFVAFGAHTWLYRILFDILPGVDRVRRPGNAIALVHFGIALLAAYGAKSLTQTSAPGEPEATETLSVWLRWGLIVAVVASVVTAAGLAFTAGSARQPILSGILDDLVLASVIVLAAYVLLRGRISGRISAGIMVTGLVAVAAIDLGTANAGKVYQYHDSRPDSYIGHDWAGSANDPLVRDLIDESRMPEGQRHRVYPVPGSGSIWANGPLVWDIDSVYGYSVLWPTYYEEFFTAASADPSSSLFDMLGIRYLVTVDPIETLYPGVSPDKFRMARAGFYRLYENPDAWNRVWIVHQSVVIPDEDTIDYLLANHDLLEELVILNRPPPSKAIHAPASAAGGARIAVYENTRVVVDVSMTAPGFLVLGDTWYPGWEVHVDGERSQLYRANHTFRAVGVPAGEHTVEFRYEPPTLRNGVVVTSLAATATLMLVMVGVLPTVRRRYRRRLRSSPREEQVVSGL